MALGKAVVVAVLAALAAYVVVLFRFLSVGQVTWDHQPGPCHLVKGIEYGSEDVEVLSDNTALITSGMKFSEKIRSLRPHVRGQVFLFDFAHPQNEAVPVHIKPGNLDLEIFNPLGIHSFVSKDGVTLVYIISIPVGDDEHARVEKFKWNPADKTLTHMRSITDPNFRLSNNLVLTGEDIFYLTNYQHSYTHIGRQVEILAFQAWATVVYYDGKRSHVVVDGLVGANGIAMSADGRLVYVSMALGSEIHVFRRHQNNSLERRNIIALNSNPDNLHVEPGTGHLWTGSHPVVWRTLQYMDDVESPAPSQVLRIKMDGESLLKIEDVFSDTGHYIYASTVAAYRNGGVLIGTIMHKALYCEVKYLTPN